MPASVFDRLFPETKCVLMRAQVDSEPILVILLCLLGIVLLATPIIALMAYSGLRRLEKASSLVSVQPLIARIYALEQRLAAIERTLSSGAAAPQPPVKESRHVELPVFPMQAAPVPPPAPPPRQETSRPHEVTTSPAQPSVFAAPPLHSAQAASRSGLDLETLIAGRWLNRIGIVALIASVSYFLKYAFDNNWIGPSGRVAIGILLGAAMLPWSQWLLSRGYSYFSEGIAGLGATVLYLSIWAGWHYYALFSQNVAFGAMIVITGVITAVALGRASQRIAVLSLLGGFLTPVMVSTGKDAQIVLFTYILILGAGMLMIAARREWRALPPVSFIGTQIYFWGWYETFYRAEKLERTILFATFFFLLYATLPALRAVAARRLREEDTLILLVNNFAYLGALYAMLWPQDRWPLTLCLLALSAAHVSAARLVPPALGKELPLARLVYAGLALTFATLAIPVRLDGKWITLAFGVEGAILVWTGFRALTALLRQAGYLLLAISAMRVLLIPLAARQFLFNERFITYVVLIACFGVALYAAQQHAETIGEQEKNGLGILAIVINVYALIALSLELWDYFGHASTGYESGLAQHLALSILWTGYASGLILLGVKRHAALLRWQALVLFGLVVIKVFLYDSSFLDRFYRILSFFVLGVVLVVVSFLYQRKLSRERPS
jgi:uncharacterized membrane protein